MSQEDPPGDYPYQPYGAPYGQQPPPHYGQGPGGYGPLPPPRSSGPSANAIVALVLNLVAIVGCCNILAIPGAILAGLSMSSSSDPGRARTFVIGSWVLFGLGFVLTIGTFLFLGLTGRLDD